MGIKVVTEELRSGSDALLIWENGEYVVYKNLTCETPNEKLIDRLLRGSDTIKYPMEVRNEI